MPVKTRRLEARLDPDTDELIIRAAALTHESLSAFVVRSARTEAERVLARADLTFMAPGQFEVLIDSLDHADPTPALDRLAVEPRVYTHR